MIDPGGLIQTVTMRYLIPFSLATACSLMVASCASTSDVSSDTQPAIASSADAESATASSFTTQDHVDWLVASFAAPKDVEPSDLEERFSETFALPFSDFIEVMKPLAGVWTIVDDDEGEVERTVTLEKGPQSITIEMMIDPDDDGRITGLQLSPGRIDPSDVTIESTDARIDSMGPQTGYGLFDISNGSCQTIHAVEADTSFSIGSVFKLWVLAAVATQVQQGEVDWKEELTLTDAVRSDPGHGVGSRETGATFSVAELAKVMISESDNTATDMLMLRVGREAVEQAMIASKVAQPERNLPLVTTKELTLLKLVEEHSGYVDLTEEEKREYLDEVLANDQSLTSLTEGDLPEPPWDIEQLGWYASASDVCRTYLLLAELNKTEGMEPMAEALTFRPELSDIAPGTISDQRWANVWFKGGSEPGVLAMAWLFEDPDGQIYVVSGAINNPDEVLSDVEAASSLEQAIILLEKLTE